MVQRLNKPASQWSNNDIVQWANGDLYTGKSTDDGKVSSEALKRLGEVTDTGSTKSTQLNAVKQLVRQHLDGKQKSDEAPVEETPIEETAGEDTQEAPQESDDVADEPDSADPAPETETTAPSTVPAGKTVVMETSKNAVTPAPASEVAKYVRERMELYAERMAPGIPYVGNDAKAVGEQNQKQLFGTIDLVLKQDGRKFSEAYSEFLRMIQKHRDKAFHETYVFRFLDPSSGAYEKYIRFISMSLAMANPATRGVAFKQVNLETAMAPFANQAYLQKVSSFFTDI